MSSINTTDLSGFSKQYAARDLPSNLKLKYREIGQAAPDEIRKDKKDLRRDLDEREKIASNKDSSGRQRLSITGDSDKSSSKKHKSIEQAPVNLDADEILPDDDDSEDSDSDEDEIDLKRRKKNNDHNEDDEDDDDDDDDDDDTEALMAELNKIKQERAAEAAKQEAERKVREEKIRVENILKGNPLLNPDAGGSKGSTAGTSSDFKVKRRWDDDVVFKNCAKLDDNKKKDFINDTLRSEFHKKFMERYVK